MSEGVTQTKAGPAILKLGPPLSHGRGWYAGMDEGRGGGGLRGRRTQTSNANRETRRETLDELGTGSACAPELTVIPRKCVYGIGRQSNPRTAQCQYRRRHHCSPAAMFPAQGLFAALPCPDKQACRRPACPFSHDPNAKEVQLVYIPVDTPKEAPAASSSAVQSRTAASVPNKRPLSSTVAGPSTSSNVPPAASEPPRKLQRTGPTKRPVAVPTATHTSVSRRID